MFFGLGFLFSLTMATANTSPEAVERVYDPIAGKIESIYRDFHKHPELSGKEFRTSKKMAGYLKELVFPSLKISEGRA